MNKPLIELQRGCQATCVVISDDSYRNLGKTIYMNANDANELLKQSSNKSFKQQLDELSNNNETIYLVVRKIDELDEINQKIYLGIVKDRNINDYNLPENVIIVFTVNDKNGLKKISNELYHFCVVAF